MYRQLDQLSPIKMRKACRAFAATSITCQIGAISKRESVGSMNILESFNPADGSVVGTVEVTPCDQVSARVASARAAQKNWGRVSLAERRTRLSRVAEDIVASSRDLGRLLTLEMGKPLAEAVGEVSHCGRSLNAELDEMYQALTPETFISNQVQSTLFYDPLGVCAAITPWNFPFAMPHWLVLPALMAGNAVILKPSEETPLIGQAYVDLFAQHLPDGLLQVVHGADEQGQALVDADVDLIAFTGSKAVGQSIMRSASRQLKRIILELGGKDPMVVLGDANIRRAARFAARNSFRNAGQVCVSTERIYVLDSMADAFVAALADETAQMHMGPGLEKRTDVGPMISQRQRAHVLSQVEDALGKGAALVAGGVKSDVGCFLSPIVLDHVNHEMDIATTETFGPVASVIRVGTVDEAIELANASEYGLGAIVFGEDEARCEAVGRRLHAGMIGINRTVGGVAGTPWVGAKHSGLGFHKSVGGHRQFSQVRVLTKSIADA